MVTCRFCGNRSFTERRRPPTAPVQQQPAQQHAPQVQQKYGIWFWACIGVVFLIGPCMVFDGAISRPSLPAPVVAPETPRGPAPQSAPATIQTTSATPAKPPDPAKAVGARAVAAGKAENAPSSESTAPFDRGTAQAALSGVDVKACKRADGPVGSGHVTIMFAPNGTVSSAAVDAPPFSGTPVGSCIAGKYRDTHVAPFSGGPVAVGKSFSLNGVRLVGMAALKRADDAVTRVGARNASRLRRWPW